MLREWGSTSERVAGAGCGAVASLTQGHVQAQQRFGEADVIPSVVAALREFGSTSEVVATNACTAVASLAQDYERNRLLLELAGAVTAPEGRGPGPGPPLLILLVALLAIPYPYHDGSSTQRSIFFS